MTGFLLCILSMYLFYIVSSPMVNFEEYLISYGRKMKKSANRQMVELLKFGDQLFNGEKSLSAVNFKTNTTNFETIVTRPLMQIDSVIESNIFESSDRTLTRARTNATKLSTLLPLPKRLPLSQPVSHPAAAEANSPSRIIISDQSPLTPSRFPPVYMILNRTDEEITRVMRHAVETGIPTQGLHPISESRIEKERAGRTCVRQTAAYNTKELDKDNYPKFIHIPKTGGTSIENIAFSVFPPGDGTHVQWGKTTKKMALIKAGIPLSDVLTVQIETLRYNKTVHPYSVCHFWHRPVD